MAGATSFDKACHRVFGGRDNGTDYLTKSAGVCCGHCGAELQAYYCEERLFLIECQGCGIKALVKASNAKSAAYMTIGAAPAADVAPVVHGRWIPQRNDAGGEYTICSICRCSLRAAAKTGSESGLMDMRSVPYCPNCGAKCDGGADDADD